MKKSSKHLRKRNRIRLVIKHQMQPFSQPGQNKVYDLHGRVSLWELLRSFPEGSKLTIGSLLSTNTPKQNPPQK